MDFTYNFEKLKNGIELFNIQDPSKLTSMLVVVIKRGSSHDPLAYGGTYHYMEHMLGSYFEYSKYGSNYNHLSMMNGSTMPTYLHIYKKFLFEESVLDSLIDNLCLFINTDSLDKNILENEKWMVNNETTSKLYDYPMMNIFFIYEQLQTGRLLSTFGRMNSLSEQAVTELKNSLSGNDYCMFLINVPSSSVSRQIKTLSKIHFRKQICKNSFLQMPSGENKIIGKNILTINSTYNISCLILPRVEPAILLYMQCTGNDVYEFTYNNKPFVVQVYNDSLVVYTSEINSVVYSNDDLIKLYMEAFIQFLYKIYKNPISENVLFFVHYYCGLVTNPIYYNMLSECKISKSVSANFYDKSIYNYRKCSDTVNISEMIGSGSHVAHSKLLDHMNQFIESFEPKFPSSVDFILARMTNMSVNSLDRFNEDTGLYYSLVPYVKEVNIDLHKLSSSLNSDLVLTVTIDYNSGIIYSNTLSYTNRTTYLCIELDIRDSYGYGFLVFYFLSGCMPYYYTIYDDTKMIMNCTYQSEKNIIEQNLKDLKYSDLYDLAVKLKSGNYDIMNSKNSFFYLIVTYLKKLDMRKLQSKGSSRLFGKNKFSLFVMNYSKLVSTEVPVRMSKIESRTRLDITSLSSMKKNYLILYNECDDVILTQIFIQYIYTLMQRLSRMRRIYMSNIRSGFDNGFYVILLNAQVQNLREEILRVYDMLDDKLQDIDFDVDVNVILINLIKLMIYYNISKFRSQTDIYSTELISEFIDLQMDKLRSQI